jgi:hypothetical protein
MLDTARELVLQSSQSVEELEKAVATAMADQKSSLRLEDEKGHIFVVAARSLAFVEIGQEKSRKVGFAP